MQGGQDHIGMLRRCLHFDDGQQNNSANGSDSKTSFGDEDVSRSAVSTAGQLPTSPLPRTIGKPIVKGTKRSGFGLHLNSIISSVQCGPTISMKRMESGSFSIRGKSSSIIRLHSSQSSRSCPLSCSEANNFLAKINNNKIEQDQTLSATPEALLSPSVAKLADFEYLKQLEPIPCDKRKYSTVNSNINEELSQSSPKKKRLKKLDVDDGDGCKRCNCKKTKCLKLYCDCFAAGIYCTDPCSCQGCFNRPEYENIVIDTRQQIQSRDPHAFAPKIVQHSTEASKKRSMEAGILSSSARHKRGCNCKKSMCLKKYCECYQANVGCSDGCRCDGCQNLYGRKKERGSNKHLSKQDIRELSDVSFGGMSQEVASTRDTLCTQQLSPQELTPQTPSFQYSNHGKDRSKSWFPSERFLPSPESATVADSYLVSPGSSGNINNHGIIQEVNKALLDLVPFHQELDNGNLVAADELSPRYHGPGSISNLPSLSGPHDRANRIRSLPISENKNISPGSSLQWRRSPISSMPSFEENKYLGAVDSDNGLCEALEDDTPDILKDNITPLNSVKVCSPNMKRVSPPHATVQELGTSSAGIKTCRKFILKSIPSFPPLTPSIVSKDKNPEPRQF